MSIVLTDDLLKKCPPFSAMEYLAWVERYKQHSRDQIKLAEEKKMATWIKSDYNFGGRAKRFVLSAREIVACSFRDKMKELEDKPAEIEKVALDLIRFFRPGLEGVIVEQITFNQMSWQFLCCHHSFPHIDNWSPPEENLVIVDGELKMGHIGIDYGPADLAKGLLGDSPSTKATMVVIDEMAEKTDDEADQMMQFFKGKSAFEPCPTHLWEKEVKPEKDWDVTIHNQTLHNFKPRELVVADPKAIIAFEELTEPKNDKGEPIILGEPPIPVVNSSWEFPLKSLRDTKLTKINEANSPVMLTDPKSK